MHGEARACELGAHLEVQSQRGHPDRHGPRHLEVEAARRSGPRGDQRRTSTFPGLVGAERHALVRQVGHGQQQGLQFGLDRLEARRRGVQLGLDRVTRAISASTDSPLALRCPTCLEAVAPGLQFLGAGLQRLRSASSALKADAIEEGLARLASFQAGDDRGEVLA